VVLLLFRCSAIIGEYKSRFGGAKSRFGCPEFPVCPVTGIRGQRLGLARYFLHQMVVFGARLTKFPVLRVNLKISPVSFRSRAHFWSEPSAGISSQSMGRSDIYGRQEPRPDRSPMTSLYAALGSMGDAKVADFLEQWIDLGAIDGGFRARQPQLLKDAGTIFRILRAERCCRSLRVTAAPD
jgi:hypothetical protein